MTTATPDALSAAPAAATTAATRRRQWGSERGSEPLAIIHARPSALKITLGRLGMVITVLSWAMYVVTIFIREFIENDNLAFRFAVEAVVYVIVVTFLAFSALMHMMSRQGAMYRFRDHQRAPRAELDRHFEPDYDRAVTVLVPSYVEEIPVVAKTLWSAALQEFNDVRVVLLIDDPPNPTDAQRQLDLAMTRALPGEIEAELAPLARRFEKFAQDQAHFIAERGGRSNLDDVRALSDEYAHAADWLDAKAETWPTHDHTDEFFVERVLVGLSSEFRLNILALEAAVAQNGHVEPERLAELSRRLVWTFRASLTSFERKQYASLSHEANKAMNLNSYIGLMGHRWRFEETADGVILREAEGDEPVDLDVPDSEYLLSLDADSMLLRDYCMRLVLLLEEEGNERVAVTQTPYSAYRGAPTRIERLAGATTDVQHILHQGLTYYGATFWVGANAVIRKIALEDIVQVEYVGGHPIKTYIQDRTVIEDTESSIDIGAHGWTLVNYPERLSFSSTPPDFGSLIVQRRRWANGGLLIMPKLTELVAERRRKREKILWREMMLRVNYMASIAWASLSLVFLLVYPFDSRLLSLWVIVAAIPYFVAYGWDLKDSGYRFADIARIYGFNLVLLAVNIAGVLKSLQQAVTGEKIPFARTPKVANRTMAPAIYVLVPYAIVVWSLFSFWRDLQVQNWGNATFAAVNAILCAWAIAAYIGIRNSIVDVVLGIVGWLWVEPKKKRERGPKTYDTSKPIDWQSILYYGERRLGRDFRREKDRRRRVTSRSGPGRR